jgi:predicted site-specific integrase-resolvase
MPSKIKNVTLYSVPELSKRLDVTKVTIRSYLREGKLKGKKIMGKWFIPGEDVIDFFENPVNKG